MRGRGAVVGGHAAAGAAAEGALVDVVLGAADVLGRGVLGLADAEAALAVREGEGAAAGGADGDGGAAVWVDGAGGVGGLDGGGGLGGGLLALRVAVEVVLVADGAVAAFDDGAGRADLGVGVEVVLLAVLWNMIFLFYKLSVTSS